MNEILARESVAWKIYGDHSDWKIFFGAGAPPRGGSDQSVQDVDWRRLDAKKRRAEPRAPAGAHPARRGLQRRASAGRTATPDEILARP